MRLLCTYIFLYNYFVSANTGEIEGQKSEIRDQERDVRAIENDLKKLNIQLHNKAGEHKELNAGNELMQTDFIAVLKVYLLYNTK